MILTSTFLDVRRRIQINIHTLFSPRFGGLQSETTIQNKAGRRQQRAMQIENSDVKEIQGPLNFTREGNFPDVLHPTHISPRCCGTQNKTSIQIETQVENEDAEKLKVIITDPIHRHSHVQMSFYLMVNLWLNQETCLSRYCTRSVSKDG